MRSKLFSIVKWAFSRTGFLYLFIFIAVVSFVDLKALASRVKVRRLNDARPEMGDLVEFAKGRIPADKFNWNPYLNYFSLVVKYMPHEEVTKMFLGVCEYYAGDPHKTAWGHIQHAAEEYPFIFWSLYNAGVLAFQRGDMDLASRYLERALILPSDQVVPAIEESVVYRQIMASGNFDVQLADQIRDVRENLYLLLAAAHFYKHDYEQAKALALFPLNQMDVKDKEPFYFYAGAASMGLGHIQEAMSYMTKCVELKSRNSQVYRYAGEIFKFSGKTDVAKDVLEKAKDLESHQSVGFFYSERLRLRLF